RRPIVDRGAGRIDHPRQNARPVVHRAAMLAGDELGHVRIAVAALYHDPVEALAPAGAHRVLGSAFHRRAFASYCGSIQYANANRIMEESTRKTWVARCSHRLREQWRTIDLESLEVLAQELWAEERWASGRRRKRRSNGCVEGYRPL
ncbi:MAG: hypothetical protein ABIS28_17235, partial [Caldimonas sp.]